MIEILLSWIYIALICILIGTGVNSLAKKNKNIPSCVDINVAQAVMLGIAILTIYAETFSIYLQSRDTVSCDNARIGRDLRIYR